MPCLRPGRCPIGHPDPIPAPPAAIAFAAGSDFCPLWATTAASHSAFAREPIGSPTEIKASLDATTFFLAALGTRAPLEVVVDFHRYATFWYDYAAVLERAGYDFAVLLADPAWESTRDLLADPQRETTGRKVIAWVKQQCVSPLAAEVAVQVSMLGRRPQLFADGSPESLVQRYLRSVADRDPDVALFLLAPELAARCRDPLREFVSERLGNDVHATLQRLVPAAGSREVFVTITETLLPPASGRTQRTVAFAVHQQPHSSRIADAPWPVPCAPAPVAAR